jgi:hypothetical protein
MDEDFITYPVITVWQPWASLIIAGAKPLEYRTRKAPTKYIGHRIAMHTGVRPLDLEDVRDLIDRLHTENFAYTGLLPEIAIPVLQAMLAEPKLVPRSCILGFATLGTPVKNEELEAIAGLPILSDLTREEDTLWGWPMNDITPIEPVVPAKGSRGWWSIKLPKDADQSLVVKIERLVFDWEIETGIMSSTTQITKNQNYQKIVSLGYVAIPTILNILKKEPSLLVNAMRDIVGDMPAYPWEPGNIKSITNAWIRWGRDNNFVSA